MRDRLWAVTGATLLEHLPTRPHERTIDILTPFSPTILSLQARSAGHASRRQRDADPHPLSYVPNTAQNDRDCGSGRSLSSD
jgi:hypothetical protein